MKFCYECGYKLEGFEKFCPECGKEFKNPDDTEDLLGSVITQLFEDIDELKRETLNFLEDLDIEDAIDDFSRNSKKALNRDADYINRARKKIKVSGENKRVIELCNKAIAVNEFNWEAYFLKGIALFDLGRYDESIEEFINSLALNEKSLESRAYIAKAYYFKGDADYALKVCDSIINIDDKYFDAYKCKALIYFHQKNYAEADEFFKKANDIFILSGELKDKWDVCLENLNDKD